jgi:hypothetical protein
MFSRSGTSGHPIVQIQPQQVRAGEPRHDLAPAQRLSAQRVFRHRVSPRPGSARWALSRPASRPAFWADQRRYRRGRSGRPMPRRRPSGLATLQLTTWRREESCPAWARQACWWLPSAPQAWLAAQLRQLQAASSQCWSPRPTTGQSGSQCRRMRAVPKGPRRPRRQRQLRACSPQQGAADPPALQCPLASQPHQPHRPRWRRRRQRDYRSRPTAPGCPGSSGYQTSLNCLRQARSQASGRCAAL